ncbi:hypothetical protein [Candidatus Laterigemmans baculatus]|uniref:hypothetical protein n=1 Tax=Candidatus Laterigemmans baculatus TaxID=2770505 RepID=UPI0013DB72C3|nr:hypothetical protein [Candidatus Laterigemmans baculatus]
MIVAKRTVTLFALLGLASSSLFTSGCGPSRDPNLPPTAYVSGQVTYNGQPVNQGTVTFHPDGVGNPGVGLLDEQGQFELSTYAPGDGAVVGSHSVTIDIPPPLDGTSPEDAYSVPKPYTDPETTPLKVSVSEDGETEVQLVLED